MVRDRQRDAVEPEPGRCGVGSCVARRRAVIEVPGVRPWRTFEVLSKATVRPAPERASEARHRIAGWASASGSAWRRPGRRPRRRARRRASRSRALGGSGRRVTGSVGVGTSVGSTTSTRVGSGEAPGRWPAGWQLSVGRRSDGRAHRSGRRSASAAVWPTAGSARTTTKPRQAKTTSAADASRQTRRRGRRLGDGRDRLQRSATGTVRDVRRLGLGRDGGIADGRQARLHARRRGIDDRLLPRAPAPLAPCSHQERPRDRHDAAASRAIRNGWNGSMTPSRSARPTVGRVGPPGSGAN